MSIIADPWDEEPLTSKSTVSNNKKGTYCIIFAVSYPSVGVVLYFVGYMLAWHLYIRPAPLLHSNSTSISFYSINMKLNDCHVVCVKGNNRHVLPQLIAVVDQNLLSTIISVGGETVLQSVCMLSPKSVQLAIQVLRRPNWTFPQQSYGNAGRWHTI